MEAVLVMYMPTWKGSSSMRNLGQMPYRSRNFTSPTITVARPGTANTKARSLSMNPGPCSCSPRAALTAASILSRTS